MSDPVQHRRSGLTEDRSSRPRRLRQPTPLEVIEKIERLRRQRLTGKQIAAEVRRRRRHCQSGSASTGPAPARRLWSPSLFAATSVVIRANSSMSISRSSAGSAPSAIGSQDDKPGVVNRHLGIGYSSSMSASTRCVPHRL